METVFAGLPFYDSLEKTDRVRTGARVPFNCPRHQLLPFQINVGTDSPGEITRVDLLDCENAATDITSYFNGGSLITGWTNAGYDTFTTAGDDISALIKTTAGDVDQGYTNAFPVAVGDVIRIVLTATVNSGTAPGILIVNSGFGTISNEVAITAGVNYIFLKATGADAASRILIINRAPQVFNGALTIASATKTSLPRLYTALSNDYFQYKGVQLFTPLPRGQWKIKLTTANGYVYYSENIVVSDIYPNLITGWSNSGYETLTRNGTIIISAINTVGAGYAFTNTFVVKKGESITVMATISLNSGEVPVMYLIGIPGIVSNTPSVINGVNTITLVSTVSGLVSVQIGNSAASNWSTSEVFVHRTYSSRFIRIDMSNAKDLGNILYQDSWAQTLFLEARLNYPTTEVVEVGDEKDGIFNVEKIVTKYIYRISTYINRAMHRVLSRISQHSSVTITDEVGNTYTPSVGNIRMEADQPHFETTHAVISFNDGENTAFDWTYDMENMT